MKTESQTRRRRIIGTDLHPDSFSAVQVTGNEISQLKKERLFTKLPTAMWEHFVTKQIPEESIIVCEAGSNSFELMRIARQAGHQTVVLNSVSAGQIAKAYCKNDPKDAFRAAKLYVCGLAEGIWEPDEETQLKREILSAYICAKKDYTRMSNRLKSFLCEHGIREKKKLLKRDGILEKIKQKYNWTPEQLFLLERMFDDLEYTVQQRERFHRMIGKSVLANPEMAKLMRLCGIRLIAAYALLAQIGDIERFRNPKSLVAYLGLAPCVHASGNHQQQGGMQKGGTTQVKAILIQAAHSILKSKNKSGERLRKWGISLGMRRGKVVAAGAVARKLAVACWYALKGFPPEILEEEIEIKAKLKKIATELKTPLIRSIGYEKVGDFVEEYTYLILTRSSEAVERWKNLQKTVFSTLCT